MLKNLSIAKRLALGFAVVLALLLLIIVVSIARLNASAQATRTMVQDPVKTERLVSDWYRNVHTGVRRTAAIARSADASLADFFAEDQAASTKSSGELQKSLEGLMRSDTEKTLYKEIGEQRKAYVAARDQIVVLKKEGKTEEAIKVLEDKFVPASKLYLAKMDALLQQQRDSVDALAREIQENHDSSLRLLVALGVVSLALGAVCAWLLSQSITRPLAEAAAVAQRVASGDLSGAIRVDRADELGRLLGNLRDMQTALVRVVSEVRRGSDSVSNASSEIAQGNHDLSARTEHQASALEETAASMEELSGTVRQNADNARQANQLAMNASTVAMEGGTTLVDKAGSTMSEVVSSIKRVTDIMGEISAASNEQSTGVAQVGEAVIQMDQATQQNAALVEEMAAASSLKAQAHDLVSVFRV